MKRRYKHLNHFDRDRIEAMLSCGVKQKEIAKVLGKDKGTISREIKRNRRKLRQSGGNKDGLYQSSVADHKAYVRRLYSKSQGQKIRENKELEDYIKKKLKLGWSPDIISGRMRVEEKSFYASKDLIYAWLYSVWGEKYTKYLYSKRDRKKRRRPKRIKKAMIPNRVGITLRPKKVDLNRQYGHLEADTIVSGRDINRLISRTSLAVVYERRAKYISARKIVSLSPKHLNIGITIMLNALTSKRTLTLDNGIENREHDKLGIDTYFCDPYSSWQKGGVENANKMIRRHIPKGSDISCYSARYISMIIEKINNRPRRSLNYKTPLEIMLENNLLKEKRAERLYEKVALGG
jgi:IS30 family transposase